MTDQQSLDDIKKLLCTYPGVTAAMVARIAKDDRVFIRFRINDMESLRAIAAASVWANVAITLGDPETSLCGEQLMSEPYDLPCDIKISDTDDEIPTQTQILGVYLSAELEKRGLITTEEVDRLHAGWNTCLAGRQKRL